MRAALDRLNDASGRALDLLGARVWIGPVVIVLVALAATLPGQRALPVIDRDEARFVQASRQMLETGDYIDPRNQDAPRYQKPVGIYWAQTATALIDGRGAAAPIHVFRIVSVAGIVLAALATWAAFLPVLGPTAAALAGIATATAAMSIGEAHIAKTDALLLAVTAGAMAALIRVWLAARDGLQHPARWAMWVLLAAGTLIKGPITLFVVGCAVAALSLRDRSGALWRALGPMPGFALFALLALPWFIAIGIVSDWQFYTLSFGEDLMGKIDMGAEGHSGPPGYYLATVWISFWPWAPFAMLAIPVLWRERRGDLAMLAAAWVVPTWLLFEAVGTKLPHYILPVLPACAALASVAILDTAPGRWLRGVAATLLVLGALALSALIVGGPLFVEERPEALSVAFAVFGLLLATAAALSLLAANMRAAGALALAAALVLMPTFTARTLPSLPVLFPTERMATLDAALDRCADRPAASLGYSEISLAVRTGTDARYPDPAEAADLLAARNGARLFITEDQSALSDSVARALGVPPREIARFDTINYNQSERRLTTRLVIHPDDTTLEACLPLAY